jgi:BirA family biotin operon repressor/biotin-[acetyl-CoA-carboxylase] ligase
VLLPPPPPLHPAGLTAAAGLAVHDAAKSLGVADVRLKWPNDVLVRDAKLSGVLVETRGLDPSAPHYVIGIGVNVTQRSFVAELVAERAVTSLALEGVAVTVDETLRAVLAHLGPRIEQVRAELQQLSESFVDAARLRGVRVRLENAGQAIDGRLAAFSLERGITVERDDGSVARAAVEHVRALTAIT